MTKQWPQSISTLNSSSHPSRGSKSFFAALVVSHSRKAKYNEVEENRAELVTPVLPFCFKVPVVPLAYLRPVNLTQPSSREDLGLNKGLTPRSPGLRPRWRRWLASSQPSSPHAIPAPAMSFPFLPFPSFTIVPLCVRILFVFAAFVLLFLTFSLANSSHTFSPYVSLSFLLNFKLACTCLYPSLSLFLFSVCIPPLSLSGQTLCLSAFVSELCVRGYIKAGIVLLLQWFLQKANFPEGKRAHGFLLLCVCVLKWVNCHCVVLRKTEDVVREEGMECGMVRRRDRWKEKEVWTSGDTVRRLSDKIMKCCRMLSSENLTWKTIIVKGIFCQNIYSRKKNLKWCN